jgi:Ribonuclease G/E
MVVLEEQSQICPNCRKYGMVIENPRLALMREMAEELGKTIICGPSYGIITSLLTRYEEMEGKG